MIECPECGQETAQADIEAIPHQRWPELLLPSGRCFSCGFTWTGAAAEDVEQRYISMHPDCWETP